MKKQFAAICLVVLMLPTCLSFVYANEGYTWVSNNLLPENVVARLLDLTDATVLDHDPTSGKVEYVSWVSYDRLSEMSTGWNTAGVVVFNSTMNAYFLRVSYTPVSGVGGLRYGALGTSNGFCYGSKATEKSEINIDNSVTINKSTVIQNPYIQSVIGEAGKTADSVTAGMKNIIDWLDLQVDATMLVNKRLDVTNKILFWIAENFNDMMYAIGQIDLLIAEVGMYQLEQLVRIQDYLDATNQNQIATYYAMNYFFYDVVDRLDSVIKNGAVQVNTTSIDARLDKLISMYSKVNSVVLDTASVNGGQITDAVGGELQDLMFWGNTRRVYPRLLNGPISYTLNGVSTSISPVVLRSVPLGTSIPAYISADPVLAAGVWKSGTTYYISDTYNAVTGEYVQRVHAWTLTGSEGISFVARGGEKSNLFLITFPDANPAPALAANGAGSNALVGSHVIAGTSPTPFVYGNTSFDADAYNSQCWIYVNGATNKPQLRTIGATASADGYRNWLRSLVTAGTPLTVHYVLADPVVSHIDPYLIAIPEGDSAISADYLRITGKYETYSSFTQTADIIAAIDRLQMGVAPDLDPIVSRLDTLISQSSDTVVNVVTNNTYITNVYQLDDENDVADRSKEGIEKIGGVFKWLWKHAFKDAFNAADVSKLDGLL